jgi:serine protease AprX
MLSRNAIALALVSQVFAVSSFAQVALRSRETARARMDSRLQNLGDHELTDVIVLYRDEQTPEPSLIGHRLALRYGVNLHTHFEHAGSSAGRLTRPEIEKLAADPDVAFIAPNQPIRAFELDKGPESVGAYAAQAAGWTGTGIGVAVIDSGVSYKNCDWVSTIWSCGGGSSSRYAAQVSFVNNLNGSWVAPDDGEDAFGHGTHVASIIGGIGTFASSYVNQWNIYPNYYIRGIAPGVNLISYRVLDQNGNGTDASVIAAINAAISNKNSLNIRVINLSLGRPVSTSYKNDPLCQAVEKAWKAGIVVVVAAGNYGRDNSAGTQGYGTITASGNDPMVITVGAVNTFGTTDRTQHKVASYSSKGPTAIDHIAKPDLVAPGNKIYATQCYECVIPALYPFDKVSDSDYATVPAGTRPGTRSKPCCTRAW